MISLYFVRHGSASSSWDVSADPGLSDLGHQQARQAARALQQITPQPVPIAASPLLRARETAQPLSDSWKAEITLAPEIAEIPSVDIPFDERREWLSHLMQAKWLGQPQYLIEWRNAILDLVHTQKRDTVFFTHFMVLNVIVGALTGTDRIVSFQPDNCAITIVDIENGLPVLRTKGDEAITVVR